LVEHELTYSASDEARATMAQASHVAKTVALRDDEGYVFVTVPATERVHLESVNHLFDRDELRLATEDEIAVDLQPCELGALPPVGPLVGALEVLDERLMGHGLAGAGDKLHSVIVHADEIARATDAKVADVCERPT
jgi:Ala-tRNA(Pro) deacylase